MSVSLELKLFIAHMNNECEGGEAKWTYNTFDYTENEITYDYSECAKRYGICNNCKENVDIYVEKCHPHRNKMDTIISIEKLEAIRDDLIVKLEEITKVLDAMKENI